MEHFLNIFYIIWNNHISRIILFVFLGLIIMTLIDMLIEHSKSKKKTKYTKSTFDMSDYHLEECEPFKDEWTVEYDTEWNKEDESYIKPTYTFEEWLCSKKGIYTSDWYTLAPYEQERLEREYERINSWLQGELYED